MATQADQTDDRKPRRLVRDTDAPVRPLRTRVTSVDAVIDRTIAKSRKALDILAKR